MKMEVVCKYFQCGFCKFGESCRKQHVNEMCSTQSCTLSSCMKRHPKVCRYFLFQKSCKFEENCSHKHIDFNNQNDISELKEKVNVLEKSIQIMSAQISDLTYKVATIKKENPEE